MIFCFAPISASPVERMGRHHASAPSGLKTSTEVAARLHVKGSSGMHHYCSCVVQFYGMQYDMPLT